MAGYCTYIQAGAQKRPPGGASYFSDFCLRRSSSRAACATCSCLRVSSNSSSSFRSFAEVAQVEPVYPQIKRGRAGPFFLPDSLFYCSPSTDTVTVTVTSVCSAIWIGESPTCLSGPCGMRMLARSTSWPCFCRASTMS